MVVVANLPRVTDGMDTNILIRGVTQKAFDVRGGIRVAGGRPFKPGLNEIIVGERASERFGLGVGTEVTLQKRGWQVVGVFASEGSGFESEIWGDVDVMRPAFQRSGGYQSMALRLRDPAELEAFGEELDSNPDFQVEMRQEREYYEAQAGGVANALLGLAVFVSVIMGIGAVFGAMNTMYAIVAARTREIGTLRALGFSRRAILFSFVIESTFLAFVGGLLGCALALPANGITTATGGPSFAELAFAFQITPGSLVAGLVFALLMGIFGGLLPAVRAARLAITTALREA
jgi:putative ABC transport system permease protein